MEEHISAQEEITFLWAKCSEYRVTLVRGTFLSDRGDSLEVRKPRGRSETQLEGSTNSARILTVADFHVVNIPCDLLF